MRIIQRFLSLVLLSVPFWALLAGPAWSDEPRTWTDSSGKYRVEAELIEVKDGKAVLRRKDGKRITVAVKRLSEGDQEFLENWLDQQGDGAESPEAQQDSPPVRAGGEETPARSNNFANSVRGAVDRTDSISRMRQIALAILNYEATTRRLPSAYIKASDGEPGLSWRVSVLPYLEENALYRRFRRDQAWDSPANRPLVAAMPGAYKSPGSAAPAGYTNYQAVVGPDTAIVDAGRGIPVRQIRDGTSMTIMLIEVDDNWAAIWTAPADYRVDKKKPYAGLGNIWNGQVLVAMVDGSVRRISTSMPWEDFVALTTRAGGERVELP